MRKAQKAGPFTGLLPVGVGVAWAAWAVAVAATAAVECEAFSVDFVVPLPAQPARARSKPRSLCLSSELRGGWRLRGLRQKCVANLRSSSVPKARLLEELAIKTPLWPFRKAGRSP